MNQEERREKRKKDTQSAVIVVAVFFIVLAVLIGGIVFAVHKFVKPGADKPEKNTESVTTEATEEPETTPVTEVSDPLMDVEYLDFVPAFLQETPDLSQHTAFRIDHHIRGMSL